MLQRLQSAQSRVENYLWLLLIPLAWPALRPFFTEGLTRSFDSGLHLLRIGALDRHVRDGMWLPRWTPELLLGYGYPLFNFYAPASYFFAEALLLLGIDAYYAFILAMACFSLAAGVGMYFLSLDIFGPGQRWPALVAATAYLYAPYLLTNVYIRGALAEVGAQALLPWTLLFARRLFYARRPEAVFLPFALTLGLLALTHNITLLFVPPLLLAYLFLHWWLSGRSTRRALWAVAGIVTAMGVSAFFWLPLIVERSYLAGTAFDIARTVWLPAAVWTWESFLDRGMTFTHSFARPIRLGLVQLVLAVAGFVLARRRDAEWLFFGAVAALTALMMSAWALPLWQQVEILTIAQFPWRLLSILSLPLALFAGGIVLAFAPGRVRAAGAAVVIGVIVLTHSPRLAWMDVYAAETASVTAAVFAQTELEKGALGGGEGNSSIQEFRPKWADRTLLLEGEDASAPAAPHITVEAANSWVTRLAVVADQPTALRFTDFYFPGWRVVLDGGEELVPYPSTNLGLLTVDVPTGTHAISVAWVGTPLQRIATIVSLVALAAAVLAGWRLRAWLPAAIAALALAAGVLGLAVTPASQPVQTPTAAIDTGALSLLGVRTSGPEAGELTVYPYWHVRERPQEGLRFRWTLIGEDGEVRAESVAKPYYNTYGAENWPANSVVDDAVLLRFPAGTSAGQFRLLASVERAATGERLAEGEVAVIGVAVGASTPVGARAELDARFGESVRLAGYEILSPRRYAVAGRGTPVLRAGDYVRLRLFWQGNAPVDENYHSFVHLLDHRRRPLVQEDQLPGPLFQPPRLWDRHTLWPDVFLLRLPHAVESGVYWPAAGMYDFASEDRLPAYVGDVGVAADDVLLGPVKILGTQQRRSTNRLDYALGDFVELVGYDLTPDTGTVAPGSAITVTLHFRSRQVTDSELVRFVQLVGPQGVVAQHDEPPQGGANPTWSWARGERIADTVRLEIGKDVAPGEYRLYAGLYDPADAGRRVPVYDGNGERVPDDWASLGTRRVMAAPD